MSRSSKMVCTLEMRISIKNEFCSAGRKHVCQSCTEQAVAMALSTHVTLGLQFR